MNTTANKSIWKFLKGILKEQINKYPHYFEVPTIIISCMFVIRYTSFCIYDRIKKSFKHWTLPLKAVNPIQNKGRRDTLSPTTQHWPSHLLVYNERQKRALNLLGPNLCCGVTPNHRTRPVCRPALAINLSNVAKQLPPIRRASANTIRASLHCKPHGKSKGHFTQKGGGLLQRRYKQNENKKEKSMARGVMYLLFHRITTGPFNTTCGNQLKCSLPPCSRISLLWNNAYYSVSVKNALDR